MICAILSRRMMSPPSYEDVLDYVDSNVTYAENKKEVLAIFGERSRKGRRVTDKDMRDMYCTSLHNQCASNGLDTCAEACKECKNPAACEKACNIETEIKKHGRELTHIERMRIEHAKEAKRGSKKAKYSVGQVVKCREGYELQCGFKGLHKITRVNAYPDYVMYGIKGKEHGFVEEDWIVGVKGKNKMDIVKVGSRMLETMKKPKRTRVELPALKNALRKAEQEGDKGKVSFCLRAIEEASGEDGKNKKKAVKTIKPLKKKKKGVIKGKPTTPKVHYEKKKLPKMPEAIKKALHLKTLTANQQALLRKYRFVDVSIQGKMYHVTKQNVKDGKVEWYRKNGKVCLKNRR